MNYFNQSQNKKVKLDCENRNCRNVIWRKPSAVSAHNFCSSSCFAIFYNTKRWGPPKIKIILTTEERKAERLATSSRGGKSRWAGYQSGYTKEFIIKEIKDFVLIHGRLPVKREMGKLYRPARENFDTWNNAVEASGFTPNPVLFAHHHKAEDGHMCDSLAEKMIDDYLYNNSISHIRNYPYPEGKYTADFKVGDILIEYFGLAGEFKKYDGILKIKKKLKTKYKLKMIEIFPNDLFPTSFLNKKLSILYLYKWIFH